MFNDLVVFIVDDVAASFQSAHEVEFLNQVLHEGAVITADAFLVHAVRHHISHLALAGRDGDGLQGGLVSTADVLAFHFEYLAEAILADEAGDVPRTEDGLILFIVVHVHTVASSPCCRFTVCFP